MNADVVDGTAVEEDRPLPAVVQTPALAVTPTVKAAELVERLNVIKDAMHNAMQRDVDYGVIPGTDKPALFKPGAEKLSVLFQLDVQLENVKHWDGDHLTVESRATVFHAPSGSRLGFGEGMCSTREKKYAKRRQERECPACGKPAVIKGKKEYGGGWLCWKKRDGCGEKFPEGDPAIESQVVGDVENPDLPDCWNTVVKMAEKRARVDAVLAVTGASALFTQDVEDGPIDSPPPGPAVRDFQAEPERSDVTVSDPWVDAIQPRLEPFRKELRALLSDAGVLVPVRVGKWSLVLAAMTPEQREAFTRHLTAREELEAGVPWEHAEDLPAVSDPESAGGQFDLDEARADA